MKIKEVPKYGYFVVDWAGFILDKCFTIGLDIVFLLEKA